MSACSVTLVPPCKSSPSLKGNCPFCSTIVLLIIGTLTESVFGSLVITIKIAPIKSKIIVHKSSRGWFFMKAYFLHLPKALFESLQEFFPRMDRVYFFEKQIHLQS